MSDVARDDDDDDDEKRFVIVIFVYRERGPGIITFKIIIIIFFFFLNKPLRRLPFFSPARHTPSKWVADKTTVIYNVISQARFN